MVARPVSGACRPGAARDRQFAAVQDARAVERAVTPSPRLRKSDTILRMLDDVLATIDQRRDASLAQLKDFLAIPTVSTKPDHAPHILRCATCLADHFNFPG